MATKADRVVGTGTWWCGAIGPQIHRGPRWIPGTGYVLPEESDPSRGRLLVFEVKETRLLLVAEKDIKGVRFGRHCKGDNGRVPAICHMRYRMNGCPDSCRGVLLLVCV